MLKAVVWCKTKLGSCESGQSLIETALMVPIVLLLTFNAVNFGWFFYVAMQITAAPHMGVEYSIQGFSTPSEPSLPTATPPKSGTDASVSTLTYQDMTNMGGSPNAIVRVCSQANGADKTPGTTVCSTVNPASATFTFPAASADPEPAAFVLNQVDVVYTVSPLIPANVFGLTLTPTLTFYRSVKMRAMN